MRLDLLQRQRGGVDGGRWAAGSVVGPADTGDEALRLRDSGSHTATLQRRMASHNLARRRLASFFHRMGLELLPVSEPEPYAAFSAAVIAQLNAEIAGAGLKRAELARKIDINYVQLGRYLKGERELPMSVLYAIVDQLPIDEATLFRLARERVDRR